MWAILDSILDTNDLFSYDRLPSANVIECTNQGTVLFGKVVGSMNIYNLWRANSLHFFSDLEYTDDDWDSVPNTTPSTLKYRVDKVDNTRAYVTVLYNGKYADILFVVATVTRRVKEAILVRAMPRLISRLLVKEDVVGTYGAKTKLVYKVDEWCLAPRMTTVTGGGVHVTVDGPHVIRFKCENKYSTTIVPGVSGGTLVFRKPQPNAAVNVYHVVIGFPGTITPITVPGGTVVFSAEDTSAVFLQIEGPQTTHKYDLECFFKV